MSSVLSSQSEIPAFVLGCGLSAVVTWYLISRQTRTVVDFLMLQYLLFITLFEGGVKFLGLVLHAAAEAASAENSPQPQKVAGVVLVFHGDDRTKCRTLCHSPCTPLGQMILHPLPHGLASGGETLCCYHCYKRFYARFRVERSSPLIEGEIKFLLLWGMRKFMRLSRTPRQSRCKDVGNNWNEWRRYCGWWKWKKVWLSCWLASHEAVSFLPQHACMRCFFCIFEVVSLLISTAPLIFEKNL